MPSLYVLAQYWGGIFYFLNKIFFWTAERASSERQKHICKVIGWTVYPIGMPGWLYIFYTNHNWIAGSVEAAGIFGMILGLRNELKGIENEPKWLNWIVRMSMVFGLWMSIRDFGGINTWNQILEILLNFGFFFGIYFLGKKRPVGYLWFLLMFGANAMLQHIQGADILAIQQIVCIAIILDAYRVQRRKLRIQAVVESNAV